MYWARCVNKFKDDEEKCEVIQMLYEQGSEDFERNL